MEENNSSISKSSLTMAQRLERWKENKVLSSSNISIKKSPVRSSSFTENKRTNTHIVTSPSYSSSILSKSDKMLENKKSFRMILSPKSSDNKPDDGSTVSSQLLPQNIHSTSEDNDLIKSRRSSIVMPKNYGTNSKKIDPEIKPPTSPPPPNQNDENINSNISKNNKLLPLSPPSYASPDKNKRSRTAIASSPKLNGINSNEFNKLSLEPSLHDSKHWTKLSPYSNTTVMMISDIVTQKSIAQSPNETNKLQLDYKNLLEKYLELKQILKQQKTEIKALKNQNNEFSNRLMMSNEELSAYIFTNSIQEQRIDELENHLSTDKINHHESVNNKSRKYKQEIMKLKQEKLSYEESANTMINQMNEQMTKLQEMAMTRIEVSFLFYA